MRLLLAIAFMSAATATWAEPQTSCSNADPQSSSTQLSCGDCTTVVPAHLCYRFASAFSWARRRLQWSISFEAQQSC